MFSYLHVVLYAGSQGHIFTPTYHTPVVSWDSSAGIATRYGLDSSGIEFWWGGEIFHNWPDWPWSPPSLLYSGYRVIPAGKVAGAWCHPPPSSAEVKERVELYLYSPFGLSWSVLWWTLPLLYSGYRIVDMRSVDLKVVPTVLWLPWRWSQQSSLKCWYPLTSYMVSYPRRLNSS